MTIEQQSGNKYHNEPESPIPNAEFNRIFPIIGSSEVASMLLVAIRDGRLYRPKQAFERVMELRGQAGEPDDIDPSNPIAYLLRSKFQSIGLTKVYKTEGKKVSDGWMITDLGIQWIPFAAKLLEFSLQVNPTLEQFIGGFNQRLTNDADAQNTGNRPATKKIELYRKLLETDQYLTVGELPDANPIDQLRQLDAAGIITYHPSRADFVAKKYQGSATPPENPLHPVSEYPRLGSELYKLIIQNPSLNLTAKEWLLFFNEHSNRKLKVGESAQWRVAAVLRSLRDSGHVTRVEQKRPGSEVSLNDLQRNMLSKILDIFDQFQIQNPRFIKEGWEFVQVLENQPGTVNYLLTKARKSAPLHDRKAHPDLTQKHVKEELEKIVVESPGLESREIIKKLEAQSSGVIFRRVVVTQALRDLEQAGKLKSAMKGQSRIWFP